MIMNRPIITHVLTAASVLALSALTACQNDTPTPPEPSPEPGQEDIYIGDGSIVVSPIPDSYFDVEPTRARNAIIARQEQQLLTTDSATNFMFAVTQVDGVQPDQMASRGKPIGPNSVTGETDQYKDFDDTFGPEGIAVTGYSYDGAWDVNSAVMMFKDRRFKRQGGPWRMDDKYYWPQRGNVRLLSYTPAQEVVPRFDGNSLYLDYTSPEHAVDQTDIMATSLDVPYESLPVSGGSESPTLKHQHLLAALRIRFAGKPGWGETARKPHHYEIKLPYRDGTYNMQTRQWENLRAGSNEWAKAGKQGSTNDPDFTGKTFAEHAYNNFQTAEQTFMVVPQTLSDAVLRIYYHNGSNADNYQEVRLPNIELKAGMITYIDVQEPSLFVEGYRNCRQRGKSNSDTQQNAWVDDNDWPIPYLYGNTSNLRDYDNHTWIGQRFDHLRLWESSSGNYYQSNYWFAFDAPVPADEADAWENNRKEYYGHRTQFNVLTYSHNGKNYFYQPEDVRQDYFLVGTSTKWSNVTISKKFKVRNDNQHREYLTIHSDNITESNTKWKKASDSHTFNVYKSPSDWTSSFLNSHGSGWQSLDGEYKVKVTPSTGYIEFTVCGTDAHPVVFPQYIVVSGSTNGFPQLTVAPRMMLDNNEYPLKFKGETPPGGNNRREPKFSNLRSYNLKFLTHQGDGRYTGTVEVCQFAPFDVARINSNYWGKYMDYGQCWTLPSWVGYGSVALYMSTLHGSYGHEDLWVYEEYESRLGVKGSFGPCSTYMNSTSGTITGLDRMFSNGAFWLKTGTYNFTYNMRDKTLVYNRTGNVSTTQFIAPYDQINFNDITSNWTLNDDGNKYFQTLPEAWNWGLNNFYYFHTLF